MAKGWSKKAMGQKAKSKAKGWSKTAKSWSRKAKGWSKKRKQCFEGRASKRKTYRKEERKENIVRIKAETKQTKSSLVWYLFKKSKARVREQEQEAVHNEDYCRPL